LMLAEAFVAGLVVGIILNLATIWFMAGIR
jgi:hypothetical protein